MAALGMFCILIVLLLFLKSDTNATTVEVTVPVQPVTVGGILAIQCKISNMDSDHTVKMFRATKAYTEELTSGMTYQLSSLGQRIFLSRRNVPGGATVFFATIVDISMLDQGEYFCKVLTLSGTDYVKVTEDSINVNVYFLPDTIYPQCESIPATTGNMQEDMQLELTCISAKGSPGVSLRWIDYANQEIHSASKSQDDTVSSEYNVRTSTNLHGKVFVCEMSSTGFPDFIRTCSIGPITIRSNSENTAVIKPNIPISHTESTPQRTLISTECDLNECRSDDKYTILYLSVATVAASMLTIVFLITTIIMCFKYQKASSEVSNAQRNIASCDGSEPVYVSLQGRMEPAIPERRSMYKDPDRSSTYMSVEDPNNPGNKVLMPKEVFEEFYNSLTLKRV